MIRDVVKNIYASLWRLCGGGWNRYIVLEEEGDSFFATKVSLHERRGVLRVSRRTSKIPLAEVKKSILPVSSCVVGLSSSSAVTIEDIVAVERSSATDKILKEELEHLLFQGLWKFLNEHRPHAGKRLDVPESKTVLANIEIIDAGVDGKSVSRVLHTCGKKISFRLRGTFVSESKLEFFESLHERFSAQVFATECGAGLAFFGKTHFPKKKAVVISGREKTNIFSVKENMLSFKKSVLWGTEKILAVIEKEYSVSRDVALSLLKMYLSEEMSPKMLASFRLFIRREIGVFEGLVLKAVSRRDGLLVIFTSISPLFIRSFVSETRIVGVSLRDILKRSGWEIQGASDSVPPALVLLPMSHPEYPELMDALERRARWITSRKRI